MPFAWIRAFSRLHERWLLLKEADVYGDDPRHAFSVRPPEYQKSLERLLRSITGASVALDRLAGNGKAGRRRLGEVCGYPAHCRSKNARIPAMLYYCRG
jgi:hypothetical protein